MGFKTCRICGESKSLELFSLRKESGKYRTECKPCRSRIAQAYHYGVSVGDIEELIHKADNRCMICGTHAEDVPHQTFKHNPLVVDHDHTTGELRGILCPTCNAGLGHFKDSPELLIKAINYLKQSTNV